MPTSQPTILLVDDDPQLRASFANLLEDEGYTLYTAPSGEAGLASIQKNMPDCVIMDVRMSGMDGIATLQAMHEIEARLPVIIMTAYSTTEAAIQATKLGAFDYLLKPFDIEEILSVIAKAVHAGKIMRNKVTLAAHEDTENTVALIGNSRTMHEIYKNIGRVAPTDALVLIRGESGTGKELVARAVYNHSTRHDKPFLVLNCVAIPETLLESELFGYERGAFTGANTRRIGKIEQARGGTIFLDEIGDVPLSIQAKLLRLLQEQTFERLGGRLTLHADVRIIAATNRDMEKAVADGTFREDLYYRLNVVSLHLPPLRERKEDIPHLVNYLLKRLAHDLNIPLPSLKSQNIEFLQTQQWPGNVRELENTLRKLLILHPNTPVSIATIRSCITTGTQTRRPETTEELTSLHEYAQKVLENDTQTALFEKIIDTMASIVIKEALQKTKGNRTHAARLLGLSRPTLQARIEKYKLH